MQAADEAAAAALLAWYDRAARDAALARAARRGRAARPLPGLALRGDAAADDRRRGRAATSRPSSPAGRRSRDLAAAPDAEVMAAWAGLGYYARARNLLACARVGGARARRPLPRHRGGARALPGVGPYTAAAIAAIAFDRPAVVVDGNVERVMARLFAVEDAAAGGEAAAARARRRR